MFVCKPSSTLLALSFACIACRNPGEPRPTAQSARTAAPSAETRAPVPASAVPVGDAPVLAVPPTQIHRVTGLRAGERRPLVLVLHGLGGSGQTMFDAFGLAKFGAAERVHVLAPDGTLDSMGRRFWEGGAACCNFERRAVDDVARLGALLRSWSARPDVDPARIYVIGYSNGGFLAHRLACTHGDLIAGVASLAGAVGEDLRTCTPNPRLALLLVHGDADDKVSYAGGRVFNDPRIGKHLSAEKGLEAWGRWLGCQGPAKPGAPLDLDPAPGSETQILTMQGCAAGHAQLWTVRGAGHFVGAPSRLLPDVWSYLTSGAKRGAD
jgi:polyhydroxybutyrate depolymerase